MGVHLRVSPRKGAFLRLSCASTQSRSDGTESSIAVLGEVVLANEASSSAALLAPGSADRKPWLKTRQGLGPYSYLLICSIVSVRSGEVLIELLTRGMMLME